MQTVATGHDLFDVVLFHFCLKSLQFIHSINTITVYLHCIQFGAIINNATLYSNAMTLICWKLYMFDAILNDTLG